MTSGSNSTEFLRSSQEKRGPLAESRPRSASFLYGLLPRRLPTQNANAGQSARKHCQAYRLGSCDRGWCNWHASNRHTVECEPGVKYLVFPIHYANFEVVVSRIRNGERR